MLKKVTLFSAILFLALFSGCINSETIVKVKADGSGEIHETILFSSMISNMINSMKSSFSSSTNAAGAPSLYDVKKLKEEVSKYGEGISFVSSEEYKTDKGEGYKAIYSFKDINNIKLNQNPGGKVDTTKNIEENMRFKMEPGKVATLRIISNSSISTKEIKAASTETMANTNSQMDSAGTQMMMNQMSKMFDGMRIKIAVSIDGDIIETNATHRIKNEIILMDMDFAKLTNDVKAFEKFSKANPKTIEETKKLIKDVKGIRIDLNDELVVKFK